VKYHLVVFEMLETLGILVKQSSDDLFDLYNNSSQLLYNFVQTQHSSQASGQYSHNRWFLYFLLHRWSGRFPTHRQSIRLRPRKRKLSSSEHSVEDDVDTDVGGSVGDSSLLLLVLSLLPPSSSSLTLPLSLSLVSPRSMQLPLCQRLQPEVSSREAYNQRFQ